MKTKMNILVTLGQYIKQYTYRPLPSLKALQELGFELCFEKEIPNGQLFVHKDITPWSDIQMLTFKNAIIAHGCAVSGLSEEHIKYGILTPPSKQKDVLPQKGYIFWSHKERKWG